MPGAMGLPGCFFVLIIGQARVQGRKPEVRIYSSGEISVLSMSMGQGVEVGVCEGIHSMCRLVRVGTCFLTHDHELSWLMHSS